MNNFERIKNCNDECKMATLIYGYFCNNLHKITNKSTGEWTSLPFLDWLRSDRNIFDEDIPEHLKVSKTPIITPSCEGCEKKECGGCLSNEYEPNVALCPNCKYVVQNRNRGDDYTDNDCPNCFQSLDLGRLVSE